MKSFNTMPIPQDVPAFMTKYYSGVVTPSYVRELIDWAEKELFDTKMYFVSIYHKKGFDRLNSKNFSFVNVLAGSGVMEFIVKYMTPKDWRKLPLVYRRVLMQAYELHKQIKSRRMNHVYSKTQS